MACKFHYLVANVYNKKNQIDWYLLEVVGDKHVLTQCVNAIVYNQFFFYSWHGFSCKAIRLLFLKQFYTVKTLNPFSNFSKITEENLVKLCESGWEDQT